jgi:homopolymeric O-antigen transport system permease protein
MSVDTSQRWIEIRPTAGYRALNLRELWEYRELLYFLALRDIQARYKQAVFGIGWAVVQPVAGVAVLALVFSRLAKVPSDGIAYPVFALVGFLVWTYFASGIAAATQSLVVNSSLVTKVYFPRLLAPLASLLPGLINLGLGFILLAVVMAIYGVAPDAALVAAPICVFSLVVATVGPGLLLATANVRYRDVNALVTVLVQLWLFASPVAYPSSLVPSEWRWLYFANPMAGVIETFRWSLVGAPWPGWPVLVSVGTIVTLLVAGLRFFQRTERQFADVI